MYINAISSSFNPKRKYTQQPHFTGLIIDKSVNPVIKNMSEEDVLELKKLKKRLSKTKFWDMKVSAIGDQIKSLKFEFIDKKMQHAVITNGIFPYDRLGDTIRIYSIIYGDENVSRNVVENLRYKSSDRAEIVYNKYMQELEIARLRGFDLTPVERIQNKALELSMLEEASHFADKNGQSRTLNTALKTKVNVGNSFEYK